MITPMPDGKNSLIILSSTPSSNISERALFIKITAADIISEAITAFAPTVNVDLRYPPIMRLNAISSIALPERDAKEYARGIPNGPIKFIKIKGNNG